MVKRKTGSLKRKIESYLYHKGFTDATLRGVMFAQLTLCAVTLVFGLTLLFLTGWLLLAFVGAAVICGNFWFLCLFMFRRFTGQYSRALLTGQLFGFFGRFLITAVILAIVFIYGGSPAAVFAGMLACGAVSAFTALYKLRAERKQGF